MKQNFYKYLKLFLTMFVFTTPLIVALTFASIPEEVTIKPIISMRIFFIIMAVGLQWILYDIIDYRYEKFKFKTTLFITSLSVSAIFFMVSLSY